MTSFTEWWRSALVLPMCMAGSLWRNSEGDWGSVEVGAEGGGGADPPLLQLSLLTVLGGRGGDIWGKRRRCNHSYTHPMRL